MAGRSITLERPETAGAVLGARLDWLELEFVVPLCLLGLVGPGCGHATRGR